MVGSSMSICNMSLADAFLTYVTKDVQKSVSSQNKIESGLGIEVVPVNTDRQTFIENYLQHLYLTKQGIFCKQRSFGNRRQDHFIYDCERSCFSKGSPPFDPAKARANGCRAYISFCFEEGATITLCILRYRLIHTGHNPANRDECKVNRIDASLRSSIQGWIEETNNVSEILLKVAKWNKTKGHVDYKDRRYFPSAHDIQQLLWSYQKTISTENGLSVKKTLKHDEVGISVLDSLSTLLKTKYRDMCIFYQSSSFNGTTAKPMILVLQTQHQKEVYRMHGEKLVFITKNFEGLRSYGCSIYSLVVKDEDDVAFPVAYILSNVDDGPPFVQALRKFQQANTSIYPRAFFIDAALAASSDGILSAYPGTKILIPRYQVLKAVHSWLSESAVAEKSHKDVREVLMKYILDLSNCSSEREFFSGTSELEQKVDYPEFTTMLKHDWLSCGEKWCDYGRNHLFATQHNSFMIERLFLNLEHQLLKGFQTIYKPEQLVEHIAKDLNYGRGSEQDGMIDMEDFLDGTPEEQAENLLADGWDRLVLWPNSDEALIPSQANSDQFYSTKLITMECECPFPPFKGLCVHLNLASMLVQRKAKEEVGSETAENARVRLAGEAHDNSDFLVERLCVTTFHSGIICVTSLSDFTCTCKASFFGFECVGVLLAKRTQSQSPVVPPVTAVEAPKQVVEYTVVSESTTPVGTDKHAEVASEKPTKKLIEDLFLWSQSVEFVDTPQLHSSLVRIMADIHSAADAAAERSSKARSKKNLDSNPKKRQNVSRQNSVDSPRKSSRLRSSISNHK